MESIVVNIGKSRGRDGPSLQGNTTVLSSPSPARNLKPGDLKLPCTHATCESKGVSYSAQEYT